MIDTNITTSTTSDAITKGRHYILAVAGSAPSGAGTGTGGCGCILQLKEGREVLRQRPFGRQVVAIATKPRMEMMAPLAAFAAMREADTPALVQSNCEFLMKGMSDWRHEWEAKNWKMVTESQ